MFEGMSDHELVSVMGEAARDESTAIAQRLLAVGELYARHAKLREEVSWWISDPTEGVAAEVSAVQKISRARAVAQVGYGRTLRERLPRLAKVFLRGTIDFRMVCTIIARTQNVTEDRIEQLDEALARRAEKWMRLSGPKLRDRVDLWVSKFDAEAVRVPAGVDEGRCVEIVPTEAGMAGIWGNIHAEDGAALSQRLDALADTVCVNDPRTKAQRRADACGPLARLEAGLACQCGSEDCPAAAVRAEASAAVIHLLAEQSTVEGTGNTPGYLPGFGILPAETVRDLAARATINPVPVPGADAAPDPRYRPSEATLEFVRWRDLTCRWPGCDQPVWRCDVDHTVPWPHGPTHASNNKCYCRAHHLIKTFCGWSDRQMPDGTVVLTSPTGHTYTTEAHGAAMFPSLAQSTGELDIPDPPPTGFSETDRTVMMPRRKQTRDEDRRDRINAERRERSRLIAEEERRRQAWLTANEKPPPF